MPILANVIEEAFAPLISIFQSILVFIHNDIVGGSWGLAIVGLTMVVRGFMVPLTLGQIRSMRRMQLIAPEVKALKAKYKDDMQRQQEEMMKLYKEKGINPLASCLPLVLQFPVLISLFYMLRADLKKHICGSSLVTHYNTLHHSAVASVGKLPSKFIEQTSCDSVAHHSAKFLFVPDITTKATGAVLIVLIVLYVGSQITSALLMSASAEPSQRWLMLGLPLFFVVILIRYPAGLLIYWITTNLLSVLQGYFVRRTMGPPPAVSKAGASPTPALAGVGAIAAPPPPPRKKKKRSGRRR